MDGSMGVSHQEHAATLAELERLISGVPEGEDVDLRPIADLIRSLREAIAPTGVVYATRRQAAAQRRLGALFTEATQRLRDFHYEKRRALLEPLVQQMVEACALADEARSDEESLRTPEGELLGNILIVGWW